MILPVLILSVTGVVLSKEIAVIKRAGETVTLYVDKTMYLENYLWTFGRFNPLTAITIVTNGEVTPVNGTRFANRLHTNIETGSITISNLTIRDSGIFLVQFLTKTGILKQRFNLTVHDNFVVFLNVLEGNNITLDTGIDELQKDHIVEWTQGPDFGGKLIAEWKNFISFIEKSFEAVLQLDPHNGSLTIMRVTQNYTGFYCVKMLLNGEPHILKQFSITVFESVSTPHISHSLVDENCYLICSEKNAPKITVYWYRGETEKAHSSNRDLSRNLTLPLEIHNQDEDIYSCVAANPVSKEAVTVNSTQWCPPHDPKGMPYGWIFGVPAVVPGALLIVALCLALRRQEEGAENSFSTENTPEETPSQRPKVSENSNQNVELEGLLTNSYGSLLTTS